MVEGCDGLTENHEYYEEINWEQEVGINKIKPASTSFWKGFIS